MIEFDHIKYRVRESGYHSRWNQGIQEQSKRGDKKVNGKSWEIIKNIWVKDCFANVLENVNIARFISIFCQRIGVINFSF